LTKEKNVAITNLENIFLHCDCYPAKQAEDSLEYLPSHSFQSALKKLKRALLNGFLNGQICRELNNLQANE